MAFGDLLSTGSNNTTSITNPFAVSAGFAVNAGDLVVVAVAERANVTVTAIDDGLGNSYTAKNTGADSGNATLRMYYSVITAAGTCTPSATTTASADDCVILAARFEGPFASPAIDTNPADTTGSSDVSPWDCPSTGALAQADELIISAISVTNSHATADVASTAPSTMAIEALSGSAGAANSISCHMNYRVVAATTAVAPQFTDAVTTTANQICAATFSFKMAAAADTLIGQACL